MDWIHVTRRNPWWVVIKTHNKTNIYSTRNTIVYDIGILLWQHVSAYLRPSSGQRTYVKDTTSAYCLYLLHMFVGLKMV